jgi:PAS domain S-box-containing protein
MADPSILIVADDAALSLRLEQMLPRLGYAAEGPCRPGADALRAGIERQPAAAVIAAADVQEGLAAAEALYSQAHLPAVLLGSPALPPDNQPWPAASLPAAFSESELAVALELARYRRSLEQAHREVAARYRTLFEASGDALIILDQGIIVDANARLRQLFAAAQEDLVGKTPFDFSPPTQPGGQPSVELGMHYIQQALAGQPQRFEWRHQRATGEPVDVDVLLLRIDINGKPHLQCILRDSAERHQLEQELREREARLRIITEHMHDLVSTCDLNGQYVYVSPSHQRLLGYLPDQLVGRSIFEYLHPDDLIQAVTKFQQGLLTLAQDSIECRYLHADGHYVWLEIIGRPMLNDAGQMIGVVFSAREITERWQARQSLQESNARLTAWVQELEQRNLRNTQLSEMIGFIQSSHTMTDACQVMAQSLGQIFAGNPGAVYITQPGPAGELQTAAEWAAAGPNAAPLPPGGGSRLTFAKPECWAMRRMQLHSTPPGKHQLRCTHIDRGASLHQPPAADLEDYAYICAPMAVDGETLGVLHLQTGGEQLA